MIEEYDALRPWYPASTTKLMTLYAVFRAVKAGEIRLDTRIVYSRERRGAAAEQDGLSGRARR